MTNEEILSEHIGVDIDECIGQDFYIEREVLQLMDEARKDEAIRFQKFVGCFIKLGEDRYIKILDSIYINNPNEYTTEQLYELFKQQEK